MAKLIRQKQQSQLGNVGIVRMTGLREQAQSWGELGQQAKQLGSVFADELGKQTAIKAKKDFAAGLLDPKYAYVASAASGENNVVEDAAGNPKRIEGQIAPIEGNVFNGMYQRTWNALAQKHNENTALSQVASQIESKFNELNDSGRYDYEEFKSFSDSYLEETLKSVHSDAVPGVTIAAKTAINKNYYGLMRAAEKKTREDALKSHANVSKINQANLERAVIEYGVDDEGTQQFFLASALHEAEILNYVNLSDEQIGQRLDEQNRRVVYGQVINKINQLSADGQYSEADMLEVQKFASSIIDGTGTVKTLAYDPDAGEVSMQEVPFSQAIPDATARDAIFKDIASVIRNKKALALEETRLTASVIANDIALSQVAATNAYISKNPTELAAAQAELKSLRERIKSLPLEEQGTLALSLAKSEAYALGKAESAAEDKYTEEFTLPMMQRLAKDVYNAMPTQLQAQAQTYGIQTDEARDFMADPLVGATKKAQTLKSQIEMMRSITSTHNAYQKKIRPIVSAVNNGESLGHTESRGALANSMIEKQQKAAGIIGPESTAKILIKDGDTYNIPLATRTIKPFVNVGIIPTQYANEARGAFANSDQEKIVAAWRVFNDMRETTNVSLTDLEKALGSDVFKALSYLNSKFTYGDDFAFNTQTIDNAQQLARGFKLDELTKADKNTINKYTEDKITSIFGDDPRIHAEMRNELYRAVEFEVFDKGTDVETATEKVWERITTGDRPRWGMSNYGVKDRWNKHPIDKFYPQLTDGGSNPAFFNSRLRAKLNAVSGGGFVIGQDTIVNMDEVSLPNESGDYLDGKYQMRFVYHRQNEAGNPIFRPVVQAAQGDSIMYVAATDSSGKLIEIDLSEDAALEDDRRAAKSDIKQLQEEIQAKLDMTKEKYNLSMSGEFGAQYEDQEYGAMMRDIIEFEEDIAALGEYSKNLNRFEIHTNESRFVRDIYNNYMGDNLKSYMNDVVGKLNSMSQDEYDAFLTMSYEEQRAKAEELGIQLTLAVPYQEPEVDGP